LEPDISKYTAVGEGAVDTKVYIIDWYAGVCEDIIRGLRFENDEVFHATYTVLETIRAVFTTPPVGTPPKNRRGV
jgi:hypothetical protein